MKEVCKKKTKPKPELKSLGNSWFRGTVNNVQKCNLIIFTTRERNRLQQLSRDAGAGRCVQCPTADGASPKQWENHFVLVEFCLSFKICHPSLTGMIYHGKKLKKTWDFGVKIPKFSSSPHVLQAPHKTELLRKHKPLRFIFPSAQAKISSQN